MSDATESFVPEGQKRGTTILIVDDDALIRLTLSDHLQDQGFKVLEATTGDEALAIMAAPGFSVDLVFTDVTMPGLTDGFALAKWIGENQPEIPVILSSGGDQKIVDAKAICEGYQFVPKPYDFDEVATRIRQTLNDKPVA